MKLEAYIQILQELRKLYGDVDLVYSSDDEGNNFSKVYHNPTPGQFTHHHEFIPQDQFNDYDDSYEFTVNSICVN